MGSAGDWGLKRAMSRKAMVAATNQRKNFISKRQISLTRQTYGRRRDARRGAGFIT
jgi:hypothetical protein